MPCNNQTGDYLSYKCYDKLKYYFDKSNLTEDGSYIFNETIKKLKGGSQNIDINHNIFSEFARFLTQDHNFLSYGDPVSCSYINFWLNNEDKNRYSSKFESKFNVFGDFATEFSTESKKKGFSRNSCKSYIKKLVDEEYRKKQILYELYDLYIQHITPKTYKDSENVCDNINIIVKGSHNAEDYIKQDEDFAKRLKELKDLIKKEKPHEGKCSNYNILDNMLPKEDPKPIAETTVMPVDNSTVKDQLQIPQHKDLKHVVGEFSDKIQTTSTVTEGLGLESNLHEVEQLKAMKPLDNPQEELSFRASPEGDPLDRAVSHENALFTTWYQAEKSLKQERALPESGATLLNETQQFRRSDTGGVLGSIQITLTDVLGSVEPAPILGVSGGMGALFLLFKYTPVGTFFRGGRRINNRIPRTFYGQFPGGLTGYDELYDGANQRQFLVILQLEHSLEEEEELTIEFPVLSMDNLQEDLQDMMIFMKEVLDQVQLIYLIGLNWNNILLHQSMSIE
ncbi:hypothetical protein PVT01_000110600 [Plasmodium vivax]|uniref:VIR protein n=1 Tax=Plasmodium vivax TaxID=5855 RepID=A0A1G4E7T6_PLAVI|nr:hypothetical protein PVT01_000110600 [Plasmodium vivax]